MMFSMTGFGRAEKETDGVHMSVELKSVNTRYLDITTSLPPSLSALERRIRNHLQETFQRGRLELCLHIHREEKSLNITVDRGAATAWIKALENLEMLLDKPGQITLALLTHQDGVMKIEQNRNDEALWPHIESLLILSEQQVIADRKREGSRLFQDIEKQLAFLVSTLTQIAQWAPRIKRELESSMRERFQDIVGDIAEESRILTEIAAWIIKADINEEIVRLESHIDVFREESGTSYAKGKKLDFLSQEMIREINTIGSKISQKEVSHHVVNMKDAVEKIREQLRNVE